MTCNLELLLLNMKVRWLLKWLSKLKEQLGIVKLVQAEFKSQAMHEVFWIC
jgi:hypothetical protein